MSIALELVRSVPDDAEGTGVGVFSDHLGNGSSSGAGAGTLDLGFLVGQGFEGKPGETRTLPGHDGRVVVAVGLGRSGEVTPATFRRAAAALARATSRRSRVASTLLSQAPDRLDGVEVARAIAEGIVLGSYRFTDYKSEPGPAELARVDIVGKGGKRVAAALERGAAVAEAVCLARDLVNTPGGTLTPRAFARKAEQLARRDGFTAEVLDKKAIEKAGLGGLLGVNRGSDEPPRFVKLAWEPDRARGTVALVGKGITFDSGGLSLKSTDGMAGMKGDMAGAAAVLATFSALDTVRPPVRVLGFLPLTDNMPGGDATRVGDVLRIRNGRTVEVLNTDAEGRLVLADALSLATEAEPDTIIDLATLTGACVVALGERVAGLMGNHDGWIDQVRAAADAAGEDVWPLPLPTDMRPQLDSDVADIKNVAGARWGGALIAGLFLKDFVGDSVPWAHLDIAGPAYASEEDAETRKGGTGFGVRTLLRLLGDYRNPVRSGND